MWNEQGINLQPVCNASAVYSRPSVGRKVATNIVRSNGLLSYVSKACFARANFETTVKMSLI